MTLIKVLYGPYEAYGVIKHREQKLHGLCRALSDSNYEVELIQINLINRLAIEMCTRQIFMCDIRNLMFNIDCEDDQVCQRIMSVVEDAVERMENDENVRKYTSIDKGKRHIELLKNIASTQELLSETDLIYEICKNE